MYDMDVSQEVVLENMLENIGVGLLVFDFNEKIFADSLAKSAQEVGRVLDYGMQLYMKKGEWLLNHPQEKFDSLSGLWFKLKFSKMTWFDGREVIMITAKDCTLRKKSYIKQQFVRCQDALTGLYNQTRCNADIKAAVEEAVETGRKGAVIFIDLDNFKNINDGLGRAYGDTLLKETAVSLHNISGVGENCYRMGGDEFVVLVTPDNYKRLDRILANITALSNTSRNIFDSECYCTMSIGVVVFPDQAGDVATIIKKADAAMYNAKNSGKNKFSFYKEIGNASIRKLEVESSMRQAVADECEEFLVYYQPIVDAATGKCVSCEALIRWNSRTLGFLNPGEFVPMAEYLGLINQIGDFILEKACIQCRQWNEAGHPEFRVNVNLSIIQLLRPDIVSNIESIIKRTGINPHNLTLEVTESLAIKDMERMMRILAGIKKLGIKTALDDFGTGYSSLNYIKQLDFDVIKVDKSFIDDIVTDDYAQAFVELIVDLATRIGAKVCVEGVEDKEQYDLLRELGASLIQGYYFSKPLPADAFEEKFMK